MNLFYNDILHVLQNIICCWLFNTTQAAGRGAASGVAAWYYCAPL